MFCKNCGNQLADAAVICPKCGVAVKAIATPGAKSRVVAAILAIFLGSLGIHEFYLGNSTSGVIRLLITLLLSFFGGGFVMGLISLIEGIIYLTKTDDDFQTIYVEGKKAWF